ncbi:MAG: hypothetical protein NC489_09030 [Ruminococcus flavefaciens]|nr:hypothetical protein [Ruminococcus flavefaciens]
MNFRYATEYPNWGAIPFGIEDLMYLQDHIRTCRAINTRTIDSRRGKYYESAICLLDAFNHIMCTGIGLTPVSCEVEIRPDCDHPSTSIVFECEHMAGYRYDEHMQMEQVLHKYQVIMLYCNTDCINGHVGYYCIGLSNMETGEYASIGTIPLSEVADPNATGHSSEMCFTANPDALRYCECFPTPAILKKMVLDAWNTIKMEEKVDEHQ